MACAVVGAAIVCSYADATGEGVVGGKTWRWEYSERFGPLFIGKNGMPLENQPKSERHPGWEAFYDWHEEHIGPVHHRRDAREELWNFHQQLLDGTLVQIGNQYFPASMVKRLAEPSHD